MKRFLERITAVFLGIALLLSAFLWWDDGYSSLSDFWKGFWLLPSLFVTALILVVVVLAFGFGILNKD